MLFLDEHYAQMALKRLPCAMALGNRNKIIRYFMVVDCNVIIDMYIFKRDTKDAAPPGSNVCHHFL